MTCKVQPSSQIQFADTDALCQQYLHIVYQDMKQFHNDDSPIAETQGELLYSGVNKLLPVMKLTQQDVFVDLGSGVGKMVVQVFLNSVVKEACGIEIVPRLYQQALLAAQRIQQDFPDFKGQHRKLTFLANDFFEVSFAMATVVFINAVCFNQKIIQQLGHIIENTPSIRLVLAMRPMPTLHRLRFKKTVRIECSWDAGLCYVYGE